MRKVAPFVAEKADMLKTYQMGGRMGYIRGYFDYNVTDNSLEIFADSQYIAFSIARDTGEHVVFYNFTKKNNASVFKSTPSV